MALGWTQSQLKESSMWFTLHKFKDIIPREQLVEFLGDFSKLRKNPALRGARIGQNLSTGLSLTLPPVNVHHTKDDSSNKYLFTDGIGKISRDIVEKIQDNLNTICTVFQIRFQGSKGILALDPELQKNTIVLRKSMVKFECFVPSANYYMDVLDQNSHKSGYLNRQIICLLDAGKI